MILKFSRLGLILLLSLLMVLAFLSQNVAAEDFAPITAENAINVRPLASIVAGTPIQFSSDGQLLVSQAIGTCCQTAAVLWDIESLSQIHFGDIRPISISPDGRFVVLSGTDKTELYNRQTGETRRLMDFGINSLFFSPDSTMFVTYSYTSEIYQLWEAETGEELGILSMSASYRIVGFRFSPDSQEIALFDQNNHVRLWNIASETERVSFPTRAFGVIYTADGSKIIMYDNRTLAIGDTQTGELLWHTAHQMSLNGAQAQLSPDGTKLLFGNDTYNWNPARLWDISNPRNLIQISDLAISPATGAMVFSPNGRWIMAYRAAAGIEIFDAETGDLITTLEPGKRISNAQFSPDSSLIFAASNDNIVRILHWDGNQATELASLPGNNLMSSPDASVIAVSLDNILMLYGIPTISRPAQAFVVTARILPSSINVRAEPHEDAAVIGVASGERVLVSGRNGNFLYLPDFGGWVRSEPTYIQLAGNFPINLLTEISAEEASSTYATPTLTPAMPTSTPRPTATATFTPGPPPEINLAADTSIELPSPAAGLVRIRPDNLSELRLLAVLSGSLAVRSYPSSSGAVADDGSFLVTAMNYNQGIKVWSLLDFSEFISPPIPTSNNYVTAASANAHLIAYGNIFDETIFLWDTESQSPHGSLHFPDNVLISSLVFSPDGQTLIAIDHSNLAYVWDIESQGIRFQIPGVGRLFFLDESQTILAIPTNAGLVRAYNSITGEIVYQFSITQSARHQNMVSIQGHHMGLADNQSLRILSLDAVNRGNELLSLNGLFNSFVFSPDGQTLATLDSDNILQLWSLETGENFYRLDLHSQSIYDPYAANPGIVFSPDGSMLVMGNPLQVLRLDTGEIVRIEGDYAVLNAQFSPDSSSLLVNTYWSTMVFGIPSESRPVWQPIQGQANGAGINVRSLPYFDAPIIAYASGEIRISGRAYNANAVYLPDFDGWIWSEPSYLDMGEAGLEDLPVLYAPEMEN